MLLQLKVKNFALIEDIQIDFSSGLNIITGQTGSGKSLIISALHLLMGKRNDHAQNARKGKSVVEGVFKSNFKLNHILKNLDLDQDDEIIIRKEISSSGKSRSFVNDTPVKTEILKLLSFELVQMNGQHLISDISSNQFKFSFIDSFISDQKLLQNYTEAYKEYAKFRKDFEELNNRSEKLKEQKDFLEYQFNELQESNLDNKDEEALKKEFDTISNQKSINKRIKEVDNLFSNENGILDLLRKANVSLGDFSQSFSSLKSHSEKLNSIFLDLEDLIHEINLDFPVKEPDYLRQQEIEEVLNNLNFLIKKFNVVTVDDLLIKKNQLSQELKQIDDMSERLVEAKIKMDTWESNCIKIANKIHALRLKHVNAICDEMNKLLAVLSMKHAKFKIEIKKTEILNEFGFDSIDLLISVNNASEYYPLKKFSSGGELSRIALAMKSLSSIKGSVPIIVFDEIDSGVSGKVATEVGKLLRKISSRSQVINITHLPQVAAMGNIHFNVEKIDDGDNVKTLINKLDRDSRIQVLAKMLGGDKTGKAALFNAQELLN